MVINLKRGVAIAIAVALVLTLVSCTMFRSRDLHTRLSREFSNIESFTAIVEVAVNSQSGENTYRSRQQYLVNESGAMLREDVLAPENLAGMTYVFAGGTMLIIPPNSVNGDSVTFEDIPETRSYTFLPEFFERYFATDVVATAEMPDAATADAVVVLELSLDGGNTYRAAQKLWLDHRTLTPLRLETFDASGDSLVTVTFVEFELNARIDEEIFDLQR